MKNRQSYSAYCAPQLKSDVKLEGGSIKQFTHWSEACQCEMTFSIFLPERVSRHEPDPPVLYYLSGLTCSDENARTKAHFAQEAGKLGLAVVFPDTSPRGVDIPGQDDSYDFGSAAGFYVNATVNNEKNVQYRPDSRQVRLIFGSCKILKLYHKLFLGKSM